MPNLNPGSYLARARLVELLYLPLVREVAGWLQVAQGMVLKRGAARLGKLARGLGLLESRCGQRWVESRLRRSLDCKGSEIWGQTIQHHTRYGAIHREEPALTRTLVLKAPADGGEKGVLLATFEYNWTRLLLGLTNEQVRWLTGKFDLVLSASSSPTSYAALSFALSRIPGILFVQACNPDECARLEHFHPRLRVLPVMPCDWIAPQLYQPKPMTRRRRDIIMVAFWGTVKRHWDLFATLKKMPASLKVTLVGQPEALDKDDIFHLAKHMGVKQDLEIHDQIPIEDVAALQCDSRVSLIMSRREGCCVAAVESLFAGCALGMRSDAHVGPVSYINERTGLLLDPRHPARDLARLLELSADLKPHHWAAENVACDRTREKVNTVLKAHAQSECRPWTADIIQPIWRPHPTFARVEDQTMLAQVYDELQRQMPSVFPVELLTESWR